MAESIPIKTSTCEVQKMEDTLTLGSHSPRPKYAVTVDTERIGRNIRGFLESREKGSLLDISILCTEVNG